MKSPLEQFTIRPLIRINGNWIDITITNSMIYTFLSIILILSFIYISLINSSIIKGKSGYIIEIIYRKKEEMIKEMLPGIYKKYIPMITSIFLFILINNLIGLVPYSFTTTAHIIFTLTMSISIMIGVTFLGVLKHKASFLKLFLPQGLNEGKIRLIIPLIFFIEVISYLIRVISLSVRLTANLMSGHTLLKILANFGLLYTKNYPILLLIPILLISVIYILEIAVAIIQAYVFTLLTATYIKDSELLH